MNTSTSPTVEQASVAYDYAHAQHAEAVTAFAKAHEALARVTLRRERMRAMLTAAETESAAYKAEWARRLREDEGELSAEVKKLRKQQRDGEELASEYRDMLEQSQIALQKAELDALLAARHMDEMRRAALLKLSELELARALEEATPGLARAFALGKLAFEQSPLLVRRFDVGKNGNEKALDKIIAAITTQADMLALDPQTVPPDLVTKRDIAPLEWSQTESQIGIQRLRAAVSATGA